MTSLVSLETVNSPSDLLIYIFSLISLDSILSHPNICFNLVMDKHNPLVIAITEIINIALYANNVTSLGYLLIDHNFIIDT